MGRGAASASKYGSESGRARHHRFFKQHGAVVNAAASLTAMTLGWASIVPPSEIALLSVTGSTQVTYSAIVMVLGTHILSRSAPQEFFHDRDPKVRHIVAPESTVGVQRRCRDWCASAKENNGIEASGTPRNTVLGWEHPSACTAFGNGWIHMGRGTLVVARGQHEARYVVAS